MTTMTFDKPGYFNRMKEAGFSEPQARAMADGLDQALREVATQRDIAAQRNEIDLLLAEVKVDVAALKSEFLAAMKANKLDFLKWFAVLIVGQTAFLTALKLLGH